MRWTVPALTLLSLTACFPIRVPDAAVAFNTECARLFAEHALDDAEAACDHALEYQDRYWDALTNKALVRLARGDRTAARGLFQRAIHANPDMAQARVDLGVMELEDGHPARAREQFREALRTNPDYAEARHDLGIACLALDEPKEAERAFRQLTLSAPLLSQGWADLGGALLVQRRFEEALGPLHHAVELEAGYADAWRGLGAAYGALGRASDARDAYERCLLAAPHDAQCRDGLSRAEQGDALTGARD